LGIEGHRRKGKDTPVRTESDSKAGLASAFGSEGPFDTVRRYYDQWPIQIARHTSRDLAHYADVDVERRA
jgi:hypothetical protein